jgi:hypothetical protein
MNKRAILALFLCATWIFAQSDNSAREKLIASLNALANSQLAERAQSVGKILTRADAERRKDLVRRKILELIGGLPAHPHSITAKQFGMLSGDGFRIEKFAYESLPEFWVTANLYVPANGSGPFPAGAARARARGDRKTEPVLLGRELCAQWDCGAGDRSLRPGRTPSVFRPGA